MSVANKVDVLQEVYSAAELNRLLDGLLLTRLEELRHRLSDYEADLAIFETRHGIPSAELYAQFESGRRGNAADYLEWLGLYDHYLRLCARIERVEKVLGNPGGN